jgi:hypothetical protein
VTAEIARRAKDPLREKSNGPAQTQGGFASGAKATGAEASVLTVSHAPRTLGSLLAVRSRVETGDDLFPRGECGN